MEHPNQKHFVDVDGVDRKHREDFKRYVVGAVDPKGRVREIVCAPRIDDPTKSHERGYCPVQLVHEEPMLTAYGKRMGWRLLRDFYERDGQAERYDEWLRIVRARADGREVRVNLDTLYPPSLHELRNNVDNDQTSQVYVQDHGFEDVTGLSESERNERLASLANQLGMEVPSEAERKKGKK